VENQDGTQQDEVLDDELTLGRQQQRISTLEGDLGLGDQGQEVPTRCANSSVAFVLAEPA
jgi:hypothetical protein